MKLAITGKGGVGKTTLSAVLSHLYAAEGRRVIAVDADPDANLAAALGIPSDKASKIRPIAEMTDVIEERMGARPGSSGGVFKLNPKVDDIPEEFGYRAGNIVLLVTGKSKEAASGCYCPENVFLRRLLRHLVLNRDEIVIVDMEAGIEHLTRGTTEAVDGFIVVVEPGQRSIQTANTVKELATGLGVKKVFVVANKVRGEEDLEFIRKQLPDAHLLGSVRFSHEIMESDIAGISPFNTKSAVDDISKIKAVLEGSVE
ncbi:MAG TPA: carbon monoxide dehydrogenase accessory protein CooC [Thermodesulfovibrionales bacterium]|jgi:CO dehydrogenase maturation factor|nr:carbon monoxide dehydrogenase accessory protein CooC [Thermodesulfovibrionales bacterium]